MADGSGHFYLELGLFGERTQHTSKSTIKARDEIQKISIDSTLRPSTQVKSTLYNCIHPRKLKNLIFLIGLLISSSADLEVQLVQLNHCDREYSNY